MNRPVSKIMAVSLLIAGANSAIAQEDGFDPDRFSPQLRLEIAAEEDNAMMEDNSMSDEIVMAKIRRALLSGPDSITRKATVAEMDAQGKMTVLRPGTNQPTERCSETTTTATTSPRN